MYLFVHLRSFDRIFPRAPAFKAGPAAYGDYCGWVVLLLKCLAADITRMVNCLDPELPEQRPGVLKFLYPPLNDYLYHFLNPLCPPVLGDFISGGTPPIPSAGFLHLSFSSSDKNVLHIYHTIFVCYNIRVLKAGILIMSDLGSIGERIDECGPLLRQMLRDMAEVTLYKIVPDDRDIISSTLKDWADNSRLDLIVTSGGTGLSSRDVTPEAMQSVIEKNIPGISEAMRVQTMIKSPFAMLSRSMAGSRSKCLIINLPGSPKSVKECFEVVLPVIPHAIEILNGKTAHTHPRPDKD
jgi:molybdopterin adenylyltransferase